MSAPDIDVEKDTHARLEDLRLTILDEMLQEVVFDGWTQQCLNKSALAAGMTTNEIERGDLLLAFPNGVADILDFWSEIEDQKMLEAFQGADPAPTRIRDKVTYLVRVRLEGLTANREAARRAAATLALPNYASLGAKLSWRTSDTIWRELGDKSMDYNFYTKRATLNAVYLSSLSHWLAEEVTTGENAYQGSWEFLDARIENIMQFEKVKAKVLKAVPNMDQALGFISKLRYGRGTTES